MDAGLCFNILEAAKRSRTTSVKKTNPISPEMIKKIIDKYAYSDASVKDLRIAAICTLGFAGLFSL